MNTSVDMINKPPHYTQGSIECIDAIQEALTPEQYIGFLKGQVIKYIWRMDHKGAALSDARKAFWYLNRLTLLNELQ